MAEATISKSATALDVVTPTGGYSSGQVVLLPDGRAGVVLGLVDPSAGDTVAVETVGQFTIAKTASIVILDGGEVMWDHSANSGTIPVYTESKDFCVGVAIGDAASADTTMIVDLNVEPKGIINLQDSAFLNANINTAGFITGAMFGGSFRAAFTATAEAQKMDLLSQNDFAVEANWIAEGVFTIITTCDADVGDLNIGVANGTHATDTDSITESCFVHMDLGADLNVDCESDDGTTEVAATDSTVDAVAGTPVHFAIDGRATADIQIYINGVNVLPASVFKLDAATGPLKLLFHLEKSANDTAGDVLLSKLEARLTADVEA